MRVALGLGYSTRRALLQSMTSREYTELRAFHHLEPFGTEREDWRQALAGAAVVSAHGGKVDAEKLIPRRVEEEEQDVDEMLSVLASLGPLTPVIAVPHVEMMSDGDSIKNVDPD